MTDNQIVARRRGRGKSQRSLDLIDAAKTILEQIQPASIRAVCYQLFNRKLLTAMVKAETDRVSSQLTWARENSIIPWAWIVDETREAERVNAFENPDDFVQVVKRSYRRDRWADQPKKVEVWSEKGTIAGTLRPVLDTYGITFRVMHGYGSSTAVHQIADESRASSKPWIALYVGDWDPSGLHMSEVDLPGRLEEYGGQVEVMRIALTEEDTPTLPSFEATTKARDPRYRWFVDHYGPSCWELDALSPAILRDRVETYTLGLLDVAAWDRAGVAERAECESLSTILNAWPGISRQARKCSEATR